MRSSSFFYRRGVSTMALTEVVSYLGESSSVDSRTFLG